MAFSSARVVKSYTKEQLVDLGVSWVWLGLEGEDSRYRKLSGVDTHALVRDLQSHGIRVLGSTIIGLEEHTPENMDERRIGSEHDGRYLQGMIDEVRIYERVLDEDEVMQNYEAGCFVPCPRECPCNARATRSDADIRVFWENQEETPNSVDITRNGTQIGDNLPVTPPSFLDEGLEPGL